MATDVRPPARPRSITRIADDSGLTTANVRTLIDLARIPTHYVGNARLVDSSDWPRLERLVKRLARRKVERQKAEQAAASSSPSTSPSPSPSVLIRLVPGSSVDT